MVKLACIKVDSVKNIVMKAVFMPKGRGYEPDSFSNILEKFYS